MSITYNPIPNDETAEVLVMFEGVADELWNARIDEAGEILRLVDTDGNVYETQDDLKARGVVEISVQPVHNVEL